MATDPLPSTDCHVLEHFWHYSSLTLSMCTHHDYASHMHQKRDIITSIDIYAYPMLLEHKFGQFIAMDKDEEAVSK
jgi:hypothetical protein